MAGKSVYISTWSSVSSQTCILGNQEWSVPRLIELSRNFEVMDIPLRHLGIYYTYKSLTLRDFVKHMRAVSRADLNFPIILDEDGDIMDGRHRVMRAMFEGRATIKAVRFDSNPYPCKVGE